MTTQINGQDASLDAAIAAAAAILARSRAAVIAGMGTDIAGARAAVVLAQKTGAAIDHMEAEAELANLEVMRRKGWLVTTPLQARSRADVILHLGSQPADPLWPRRTGRNVHYLSTDASGPLLQRLAVLRMLIAGREVTGAEAALRDLAGALQAAKFGVAVWPAGLSVLDVEMLCGLVDDLNKTTRFAGLPLPPGHGAAGVTQALAWATGFPMRTGFALERPVHDPWRFDARRLVAAGEVDAVLWISAFAPLVPPWPPPPDPAPPVIAVVAPGTRFTTPPAVLIEVGCPGRDHGAMLFEPSLGGLAFAAATVATDAADVAGVLTAITQSLPAC